MPETDLIQQPRPTKGALAKRLGWHAGCGHAVFARHPSCYHAARRALDRYLNGHHSCSGFLSGKSSRNQRHPNRSFSNELLEARTDDRGTLFGRFGHNLWEPLSDGEYSSDLVGNRISALLSSGGVCMDCAVAGIPLSSGRWFLPIPTHLDSIAACPCGRTQLGLL